MIQEFTVTIRGEGDNVNEAWLEAVQALSQDPGDYPDNYVTIDDD